VELFPPEMVTEIPDVHRAEEVRWHADKFFLLDKPLDFGFSGSPVVTADGKLTGMQCATNKPAGLSWALKAITFKKRYTPS
jgi:S1-C subfamily serine protease